MTCDLPLMEGCGAQTAGCCLNSLTARQNLFIFSSFAQSFSSWRCSTGNLPDACGKSRGSFPAKPDTRRRASFSPAISSPAPSSFSSSCPLSPASSWSSLDSACSSFARQLGSQSGCFFLVFYFLPLGDYYLTLQTLFDLNICPAFCGLHSASPLPSVSGAWSGSTGWRTTPIFSASPTLPSPFVSSLWQSCC